jgi:hypothetical protein
MIADENVIEAIVIPTEISIAEILDERDSEDFSRRWMAAFNVLESKKDQMSKNQTDLSEQIRETAYLRAFARWKSPDLAASVSDDFGLISDAAALAMDDPWVDWMLQSYRKGVIPCAEEEN